MPYQWSDGTLPAEHALVESQKQCARKNTPSKVYHFCCTV